MSFIALNNFLANGLAKKKGEPVSKEEAELVGLSKKGYLFDDAKVTQPVDPIAPPPEPVDPVIEEPKEEVKHEHKHDGHKKKKDK